MLLTITISTICRTLWSIRKQFVNLHIPRVAVPGVFSFLFSHNSYQIPSDPSFHVYLDRVGNHLTVSSLGSLGNGEMRLFEGRKIDKNSCRNNVYAEIAKKHQHRTLIILNKAEGKQRETEVLVRV